ncbi:unnamed protein product [Oppiella nova]|uniref:riboflavin kinase n=1 Tax=Oppiella nova TaxID=334625 RepID=A0A7R9QQM3_9ACAR|nr:unnamed protein product [Oppiella nova]CAG2172015.1 unnamed protein product [Oppiella nova]
MSSWTPSALLKILRKVLAMQTTSERLREPFRVTGEVVHGFGRGSKQLGIPTANIDPNVVQTIDNQLKSGIYYGFCQLVSTPEPVINGETHAANGVDSTPRPLSPIYGMVCSLGWNPQFNNTIRSLEVHILSKFSDDFYGSTLRVAICGYIRAEQKFESLDQLIECIHNDIKVTEQALEDRSQWSRVLNGEFFGNQ